MNLQPRAKAWATPDNFYTCIYLGMRCTIHWHALHHTKDAGLVRQHSYFAVALIQKMCDSFASRIRRFALVKVGYMPLPL